MMNADEIIKCENNLPEVLRIIAYPSMYRKDLEAAAALIEALQADKLEMQDTIANYHCEIDRLRSQLAEAQRRADAAMEEIYKIAACDACKHYDPDENDCAKPMVDSHKCFEWRGPVAEKG